MSLLCSCGCQNDTFGIRLRISICESSLEIFNCRLIFTVLRLPSTPESRQVAEQLQTCPMSPFASWFRAKIRASKKSLGRLRHLRRLADIRPTLGLVLYARPRPEFHNAENLSRKEQRPGETEELNQDDLLLRPSGASSLQIPNPRVTLGFILGYNSSPLRSCSTVSR